MDEDNILDAPSDKPKYYFRVWPIITWSIFLFFGLIFKVMHWPGANVLIIICSAGLFAWSLTDWIFLKPIKFVIPIVSVISIAWFATIIWGATLNNGRPFNYNGIVFYLGVFAVYFLVYYLLKRFAKFYRE